MKETVAAGELRHRVTFQDPIEEQDPETGDIVVTGWTDTFPNVPAAIVYSTSREALYAAQVESQLVGVIIVRWRPGIHAKQRILHTTSEGTRVFNISGHLPDISTGRRFLTIPVSAGEL